MTWNQPYGNTAAYAGDEGEDHSEARLVPLRTHLRITLTSIRQPPNRVLVCFKVRFMSPLKSTGIATTITACMLASAVDRAHPKLMASTPAQGTEGIAPKKIEHHLSGTM